MNNDEPQYLIELDEDEVDRNRLMVEAANIKGLLNDYNEFGHPIEPGGPLSPLAKSVLDVLAELCQERDEALRRMAEAASIIEDFVLDEVVDVEGFKTLDDMLAEKADELEGLYATEYDNERLRKALDKCGEVLELARYLLKGTGATGNDRAAIDEAITEANEALGLTDDVQPEAAEAESRE